MILLSFDIEEFDAPLEHGVELPFEEQMRTSVEGTRKILACLARHRVKATFFCTANFALHAKDLILDIQKGGHEIASHGFYHSSFETADLRKSKEALEELTGQPVNGFRMARMMPVEELPFIMTNHSGCGMERRLDALIRFFKDKRAPFGTYTQFSQEILSKSHGQE